MPRTTRRTLILAAATTAVLATGVTVASAAPRRAAGTTTASVTGSASFRLTFAPDADVRSFAFDAHAVPYSRPMPGTGAPHGLPTDATGTVRISHYVAAQHLTVRAEATVDCLATSPGNATLTAKVVRADAPVTDWVGKRFGFSVNDRGRHDWVGLSWVVGNATQDDQGTWVESQVGTCMAPAAFAPVTRGDYRVHHVDLPVPPKD